MPRRRQFTIASLMVLVLGSAVLLALLRNPDSKLALAMLCLAGLLFVASASIIYVLVACVVLVIRLSRRMWSTRRAPLMKWSPDEAREPMT